MGYHCSDWNLLDDLVGKTRHSGLLGRWSINQLMRGSQLAVVKPVGGGRLTDLIKNQIRTHISAGGMIDEIGIGRKLCQDFLCCGRCLGWGWGWGRCLGWG